MYTLKHYFEEAQVEPIPEWFETITLHHPVLGFEIQPRWHQITGLNLCFVQTRTGLYDEQGTGKTLIMQAFAIWQAAVDNGAICVMPPILAGQFRDSLLNTFKGVDKHLTVEIYRGTKAKRQKLLNKWQNDWPHIVIMSYELFREEWQCFSHYESLIADEAKPISNETNKTSIAINTFMGKFEDKYAIVANGTPARTDLSGLYGYIRFTSPDIYKSRIHFNMKHVVFKKLPVRINSNGVEKIRDVKVVDHFINVKDLYHSLYRNGRRVEKQEVVELPEKNIIPYKFELSEKHAELYTSFIKNKLLLFDDNTVLDGTNSSALRNNAMQAVIHTDMLQLEEESAIFAAIHEIMEGVGMEDRKVFLLAHYQKTVEKVAEFLKQYNPAVIYGPTSGKNDKEKNRFLNDSDCRACIANYLSGGVGLNLQDVASDIIAVEPTGVPGDFDQAVDRLHRMGQKNKVNVYVLMPKGTVFVPVVNVMLKRKEQTKTVVSRKQLQAELLGEE